ncbi:GLI pathogenesis-related 2 [Engraulis encrasicolus]|uniref:GLI pathogenesis-related 2 n=1 Tax=Engraulis encrasicolus TaxID=184585 RepID=UPI002FD13C33
MAGSTFQREFLDAHNSYRKQHGAPPLAISRDLCRSAQKWADHLLATKAMQHSDAEDYGENLYYSWSSAPKSVDGKDAVENWYSEIKDYNFKRPGFQSGTGHFTQVVWKGSKEVGVGLATDGKTVFVVGQYQPAGNISNPGYFEKNVLPAGSPVKVDADDESGGSDPKSRFTGRKPNGVPTSGGNFQREFLDAHNSYRKQHGAPPLAISRDLCRSAQDWADHLLATKKMQHSQDDHGENLFHAWSSIPKKIHGKVAVENWYNEIKDYSFKRPGFQSDTGHFTQVVWKGSKELGVGIATDGNTIIVVGQYLPAGNITNPGYFEKNVLPEGSPVQADTPDGSDRNNRWSPSKKNSVDSVASKLNSLSTKDGNFEREFLDAHNSYRKQHGAPPLAITRDLCRSAQKWADHLLATKAMQHSDAEDYGENLYYTWSSTPKNVHGKEAVENWYSEIKDYNFKRPGFQSGTGHFTQVVWKGSKQVGVGLATDGNTVFVVGQYVPAGNISNPGYFEKNVLPAGSPVIVDDSADDGPGSYNRNTSPSGKLTQGGQKEFRDSAVDTINRYRKQHGAKPLSLSLALSKEAQDFATTLVASRTLRNQGKGHGESLFYQSGSISATPQGSDVAKSWYDESSKYKFSSPGFQKGTGNFTQMVWKSSETVGIGLATDGSGMFIGVAFFEPAGNVSNPGYFKDNVSSKIY